MSHFQKKRHGGYYNQKFIKKKREHVLEPGLKGFICTCNSRERDCVKESYNILNEYADRLYGNEQGNEATSSNPNSEDTKDEEEDIEDALSRELGNLKQEQRRPYRFHVVKSGATNCLFITTTLPDPTELAYSIMNDIYTTKQQKSRFLLRLIPIEVTCKAYMDEIQKSASALFDKYFSKEGKTFAIAFNHRNNNSLSRSTVIEELAEMIKFRHVDNKVDLTKPQLTVIVEIVRTICCISVVRDYFKFLKYNLLELSGRGDKAAQEAKCAGDTGTSTKSDVKSEVQSDNTNDEKLETEIPSEKVLDQNIPVDSVKTDKDQNVPEDTVKTDDQNVPEDTMKTDEDTKSDGSPPNDQIAADCEKTD